MRFITALYAGIGLLIILISVPMILRWVPPNKWYGFRTPRTLSDPDVWYASNQISGQYMATAGVFILIAAGVVSLFGHSLSTSTAAIVMVTLTLISLFTAVGASFAALRRI